MVRNHTCPKLRQYQEHAEEYGACRPRFSEDGETVGCDETNWIKIEYCPFCGVKLDDNINK